MKFKNNNSNKFIKFLNGKAFYAVLCICFIGIGVAAWSGVQGLKAVNDLQNSSLNSFTFSQPQPSDELKHDTELFPIPETGEQNSSVIETETERDQSEHTQSAPDSAETVGTEATFFVDPVLGRVLKDFSDTNLQYSMTYGDMRLHKGLDIAAAVGTPVTAAGNGEVTAVENDAFYGAVVEIDHGNGITAKYCGLNSVPCVKVGDIVDSSTQIGTVDIVPCESVEERHLHLEFYLNGKAVSPLKYINQ